MSDKLKSAEQLAFQFHEAYERLAPAFGYETREETQVFNIDSPNGQLMVAVCGEILKQIRLANDTKEIN